MLLRGIHPWLHDENIDNLCRAGPPGGLLVGSDDSALAGCKNLAANLKRNSSRINRSTYPTCAVVGSGAGLARSGLGVFIDGHSAIFRVNLAPASRFERDVGSRTDFRVSTHYPWRIGVAGTRPSVSMTPSINGTRSTRRAVSHLLYCHNGWVGKCYDDALHPKPWQRGALPLHLNPRLAGALLAVAGPVRKGRAPTAGLLAVAAALNLCANVSIFGFSDALGASTANASAGRCLYYFTCASTEAAYAKGSSAAHDLAHQHRVLALLEAQQVIRRFAT